MKKNKVAYMFVIAVLIVSIAVTISRGLNVGIYYGDGIVISFRVGKDIDIKDIKEIAKEVWPNQEILVQKVELFGDSASIKIKNDPTVDEITSLKDKINAKYSANTETSEYDSNYVSNVRIRSIIKPYILPIGISLLLILVFYAIRFKGTKQMLGLIKYITIVEILLYGIYAIIYVPINVLSFPIALSLYALTVIIYTGKANLEKANEE